MPAEFAALARVMTCEWPPSPMTAVLHPESWLTVTINGKDNRDFLQRMLCCDLERLTPTRALPGAWCDLQGRVMCFMLLFMWQRNIFLLAPRGTAEVMLAGLSKYILRDDVQFTESNDIELAGIVTESIGTSEAWQTSTASDGAVCINIPGPQTRHLHVQQAAKDSWQQSQENDIALQKWLALDAVSGIPWQFRYDCGHHLPQALGLDRIAAIDFAKGCYPGQEIITRVQHRGEIKRGLYCCTAPQLLPPGAEITTSDGAQAGEIIYSADCGKSPHIALMVASHNKVDNPVYCASVQLSVYNLPVITI